jgi:Cu-Zn family superoxide dismutase
MTLRILTMTSAFLLAAASSAAADLSADIYLATPEGPGESIGSVTIATTADGTVLTPELEGLPPGEHGFHIHAKGDCAPGPNTEGQVVPAGAAGGHWDPANTGKHAGPEGDGHLGDLPALTVAADGTATGAVTAPRIKDAAPLSGLALMIHEGGDNHSDQPRPLGGGGGRIACGVIE